MTSSVVQEKGDLRLNLLAKRRKMSVEVTASAAEAIAFHAMASGLVRPGMTVAAYVSTRLEPGTQPLLEALSDLGCTVLLPVSGDDGVLDWAVNTKETTKGRFGIDEPVGQRLGSDAIGRCAVVFLPALAVDHRGNRLGRGAGYYDRALETYKGITIALVYDDELVESIPSEPHDVPVTMALAPGGLFRPHIA